MVLYELVLDGDRCFKTIKEVRLALVRKRKLERKEELNKSTVCVVSIHRHELVRVVGLLLCWHYCRVLCRRVDSEIVLLCRNSVHRVLIVVNFKLVSLLGTEVANREFFVITLDLHNNKQKFPVLYWLGKLFKLCWSLNDVIRLSGVHSLPPICECVFNEFSCVLFDKWLEMFLEHIKVLFCK